MTGSIVRALRRLMLAAGMESRNDRRRRPFANRVLRTFEAECLESRELLTFDIVFDYSLDSTNFFAPQERRDTLDAAAAVFESRITDDLLAITPGGTNTWTAVLNNPSTGFQVNIDNLTISADTVVIYVGARDLASGVGLGGPGGFDATGTISFVESIQTRGEAGVDPNGTSDTDFAPWGGTIAFDNTVPWNFGLDAPAGSENDLYSVAIHEIGHVLGFGTSDSHENLINGSNEHIGPKSVEAFGGNVPMWAPNGVPDTGHWDSGTSSTIPGTTTVQETSMDPQLTNGTRKVFTVLDFAAIDDLGWDVTEVAGPQDFGDAPDLSTGSGPGNYQTRSADSGPSHEIVSGLFIGAGVDADDGTLQNTTATADDELGNDDEDFFLSNALFGVEGQVTLIDVNVTNTVGDATLYGWIDLTETVFSNQTNAR